MVINKIALAAKIYGVEALNTMRIDLRQEARGNWARSVKARVCPQGHRHALVDRHLDVGSVKRAVESRQVNNTEDTYSVHTLGPSAQGATTLPASKRKPQNVATGQGSSS